MPNKTKNDNAIPFDDLSNRIKEFCHKYLELGEKRGAGSGAAIHVGVSDKSAASTASRWLRKVRILEYIQTLRDRTSLVSGIDREYVMAELVANLVSAKAAKDHNAVNASIRLVGIELGMFTERKAVEDLRKAAPPVERMPMADYMKAVKKAGYGGDLDDQGKVVSIKGKK